jgi:hypothetical protein
MRYYHILQTRKYFVNSTLETVLTLGRFKFWQQLANSLFEYNRHWYVSNSKAHDLRLFAQDFHLYTYERMWFYIEIWFLGKGILCIVMNWYNLNGGRGLFWIWKSVTCFMKNNHFDVVKYYGSIEMNVKLWINKRGKFNVLIWDKENSDWVQNKLVRCLNN